MIRCVIVDDQALFREGLRRVLEDEGDIRVVGEASDAAQALEKVKALHPDVLLMDVRMPGMSSFEAARRLQKEVPATSIIFLTMHSDEGYLQQFLDVRASAYILKDTPGPTLIAAMRDVFMGRKFLSPQLVGKVTEDTPQGRKVRVLTPRERQVVKMIAEGCSVKEIANLLGLSVKTVEAHKFNLMRKLDIHNKARLVTYAIQNQIVKMPTGT